jgi:hypothetical protein
VFDRIFQVLSEDADFEYVIIDGTIVRVHQHGAGARGGTQAQAIGRSRGGLTTKIVAPRFREGRLWSMGWATSCASSCCRGNDTTASASPRC